MKRTLLVMVVVVFLQPTFAQLALTLGASSVLVEDTFDGSASAPPDATRFEWGGDVAQNGSGQLGVSTWTANQSWVRSKAGAAPGLDETLILQMRAYAYAEGWNPGIYGDGQPRGLRVGNDANNAAEFYSLSRTIVGMRVHKDGVASTASYALPSGVDMMHDYEISVSTTSVCFRVDGIPAGTFTNNIPTGALNLYVSSFDGYAGNVPVSLDSVSLSLTNNQPVGVPPAITDQPASATINVSSNATFTVTATGTEPLSYQWMKDGGNLNEATNAFLTLLNVQGNQAGNYTVVITNAWGSVTSSVATLTVNCPNIATWGASNGGVPVDLTNAVRIAAGRGHTLALRSDGKVVGWGGYTVPTGLSNVVEVAAGEEHGLALRADGIVAAWGKNNYEQCNVPAGLSNVVAVAVGGNHNLALRGDGTVVAWGINWEGQCNVPVGLSNVVAVAAGGWYYASHSLALRSDGTVIAWGWNGNGQCNVPAGLSNVVAVAAGTSHSLALRADGTVVAWGWDGYGACNVPADLTDVVAVEGGYHSLALKSDGTVVAWGFNQYGQCNASGVSNVTAISAGDYHSAVLFGVGQPFLGPMVNQVQARVGEMVFLKACPTGELPMNCQWQKDGVILPDATSALLTISNAALADAGSYQVVVTNGWGSVTSQIATLSVTVSCPVITSFSPTNGPIGTVVAINGSGFSSASGVQLNGVELPFVVGSDTQITATVITGATSGLITVTNPGGTGTSLATFQVCSPATDFTYTTNAEEVTITGYTGSGGVVTIPDTIDCLPVTGIGSYAFKNCASLTSAIIGNNVRSIGYQAFYSCDNLTRLTISESVTAIGGYAFYHSDNLTNIIIPNSVTTIGDYAFTYCTMTTNITIGSGVTAIGRGSFDFCRNLGAITVDALNAAYCSAEGVLFNKSQTTLIQYPGGKTGSYTIPAGVTTIGDSAFYSCDKLTGITLPDSLTSIGSSAFRVCSSLTVITIPSSVTRIGSLAFTQCSSLAAITVDALNPIYSSVDGVLFNKNQTTLIQCPGGKPGSYTIPSGVTTIGGWAISYCTGLTSITVPESVTSIGGSGFYYCTALRGIYFKGNAPGLGTQAFTYDTLVTIYHLPETTGWDSLFGGRPVVLWNPHTSDATFGVRTNQFGFSISGTSNLIVVVEACTDLANPTWVPLQTNMLTDGSCYFSDPQSTNYPGRLYRLRSP